MRRIRLTNQVLNSYNEDGVTYFQQTMPFNFQPDHRLKVLNVNVLENIGTDYTLNDLKKNLLCNVPAEHLDQLNRWQNITFIMRVVLPDIETDNVFGDLLSRTRFTLPNLTSKLNERDLTQQCIVNRTTIHEITVTDPRISPRVNIQYCEYDVHFFGGVCSSKFTWRIRPTPFTYRDGIFFFTYGPLMIEEQFLLFEYEINGIKYQVLPPESRILGRKYQKMTRRLTNPDRFDFVFKADNRAYRDLLLPEPNNGELNYIYTMNMTWPYIFRTGFELMNDMFYAMDENNQIDLTKLNNLLQIVVRELYPILESTENTKSIRLLSIDQFQETGLVRLNGASRHKYYDHLLQISIPQNTIHFAALNESGNNSPLLKYKVIVDCILYHGGQQIY